MFLMLHIAIAIATVAAAFYAAIAPTKARISTASIGLIATVVSGVSLMVISPHAIAHACVSGIVTIVAVIALKAVAIRRLAAQEI